MSRSPLYYKELITRRIPLDFEYIGNEIKQTLEKWVKYNLEGKCSIEGFIRPDTSRVLSYSSGVVRGERVIFEVVFECQVCKPVNGLVFPCVVENVTKAGIRAHSVEEPSPVDVFCARDHHFDYSKFSEIKEGSTIEVKVIGQRYELNDPKVSVIAQVIG